MEREKGRERERREVHPIIITYSQLGPLITY
jgi:hypothetical protein